MKKLVKIVAALVGGITALMLALALIVWAKPPELIRIGANYTAKMVCSNVYLAGRDPREVLQTDVQAPGHPLLELMRASVDMNRGIVRAGIFGFIGGGLAVARPDVGCVAVPDGKLPTVAPSDQGPVHLPRVGAKWHQEIDAARSPANGHGRWPAADEDTVVGRHAGLDQVLANEMLAGPGMRAIVIIHGGELLAERYGAGFTKETPQLGWSMTKSVTAGLIGVLVGEGRLRLDESAGWAGDERRGIAIADLLAMSSGLEFDEGHGAVSDLTRMLYLERLGPLRSISDPRRRLGGP